MKVFETSRIGLPGLFSLLGLCLGLLAQQASAQTQAEKNEVQRRYQEDGSGLYMQVATGQALADCLREARNSRAEFMHSAPPHAPKEELERNQRQRCDVHQGADREACEARMRGEGQRSGSVEGGGVMREISRPEPRRGRP